MAPHKTSQRPDKARETAFTANSNSSAQAHNQQSTSLTVIQRQRERLPIYGAREQIITAVRANPVVVLVGETASGKTTQIPQFLVDAKLFDCDGINKNGQDKRADNAVCITQPRRVAAMSIARRVAQEQGCALGEKVGYRVRFDDRTSGARTRVVFMTDGILMREVLSDPLLRRYSVIILDEVHERSLRTDILFGLVKGILQRRPTDLKVVVMSATMDADKFAAYFNGAPVLYVEGRQHPVRVLNTVQPIPDYVDAAMVTVFQLHMEQKMTRGDVLVFLSGQEEIEMLEKSIREYAKDLPPTVLKIIVCPLFSSLPAHQQTAVFEPTPPGCRKVILSTNIAETSVTIAGVRFVIDSGVQKVRGFHSKTGIDTLTIEALSKASARQRMGRAGREAPGVCYRLYTEETFHQLRENECPEIRRCNLSGVVLLLKAVNVEDILSFDFIDPPPRPALLHALESLYLLGALDHNQALTKLGRQMATFPLDPALSKILIMSQSYRCTSEAIAIIALLSVDTLFHSPSDKREEAAEARRKFVSTDGDMLTFLNAFKAYLTTGKDKQWCIDNFISQRSLKNVMDIQKQLRDFCQQASIDPSISCDHDHDRVLRCLLTGLSQNIAALQPDGTTYKCLATNQLVHIHPSSVLFQRKTELIIYQELVSTSKKYVRKVSRVSPEWLLETASANGSGSR